MSFSFGINECLRERMLWFCDFLKVSSFVVSPSKVETEMGAIIAYIISSGLTPTDGFRHYIRGVCSFIYNFKNVVVRGFKMLNVLKDQNPPQPKQSPKKSKKPLWMTLTESDRCSCYCWCTERKCPPCYLGDEKIACKMSIVVSKSNSTDFFRSFARVGKFWIRSRQNSNQNSGQAVSHLQERSWLQIFETISCW